MIYVVVFMAVLNLASLAVIYRLVTFLVPRIATNTPALTPSKQTKVKADRPPQQVNEVAIADAPPEDIMRALAMESGRMSDYQPVGDFEVIKPEP